MSLKAKLEAIIYATEEPATLNELASLLKELVVADLQAAGHSDPATVEVDAEAAPSAVDQQANAAQDDEAPEGPDHQAAATVPAPAKNDFPAEDKELAKAVKARLSTLLDELVADYASPDRGMEIRQVAGGYRMATKPEHHDVVVSFAKSLKPPVRLSLQALETLAVIAYRQPVTVPEISEVRGVDAAGVIATLLDRKLITTAGRKQVIGRPILYKTTKEFLLRFGLKDVSELPSVEEFEKLGEPQTELFGASPENPSPEQGANTPPGSPDAVPEPVTEAVPEVSPAAPLKGDSTVPADGTYATEAEPQEAESSDPHAG
jgi:segregation and condensation protein B